MSLKYFHVLKYFHDGQCKVQNLYLCVDGTCGIPQHSHYKVRLPFFIPATAEVEIFCRAAFLVRSENSAGEVRDFNHPIFQVSHFLVVKGGDDDDGWLQVSVMMLGESLCLIVFLLTRPPPSSQPSHQTEALEVRDSQKESIILLTPATFINPFRAWKPPICHRDKAKGKKFPY